MAGLRGHEETGARLAAVRLSAANSARVSGTAATPALLLNERSPAGVRRFHIASVCANLPKIPKVARPTREHETEPTMSTPALILNIPPWVDEVVRSFNRPLTSDEARMALTVRLSQENVIRGGGPFGATVFAADRLLAAGVNLVLGSGFSIAHAEIIALMRAQAALGEASLKPPPLTLFASTEPCCQCFGALVWAGVRRLVCGANTADAEAVGFDEGPKPAAWVSVLEQRGIAVSEGVQRSEAQAVLADYIARGGRIYGKFPGAEPAQPA